MKFDKDCSMRSSWYFNLWNFLEVPALWIAPFLISSKDTDVLLFLYFFGNFSGSLEDDHWLLNVEASGLKLASWLWVTYLSIFRSCWGRFVNGEKHCDENCKFCLGSLWEWGIWGSFFAQWLNCLWNVPLPSSLTRWKYLCGLETNWNHFVYYNNMNISNNDDDAFY